MLDKFHEECGVVAVFGHPEAANLAYLGLYALQHRGQESAGMCSSDGREVYSVKQMGYIADIFTPEQLASIDFLTARFGALPKVLRVKDVVTVDVEIPGCPMDPKMFLAKVNALVAELRPAK